MQDPASRDEAFLSGFAQRAFSRELPEELIMWMVNEGEHLFSLGNAQANTGIPVCIGKSEALSAKYIQLLGVSPSPTFAFAYALTF